MRALTQLIRRIIPRGMRNALRRPRATKERIMAKLSYVFGQTATAKLAEGFVVKCHPMCVSEFSVFTSQPEQTDEMKSFIRMARPGMKMMDIGAHWGALTLAALHFGKDQARVLAIEASDEAAKIFKLNISLNKVNDRVILVNAACGDRSGEIPMLTTGAGGADFFVISADDRPDTVKVKQVTADSMREEHAFHPTHLKIDVEGYEEEVLLGAPRILRELKPIVLFELHGDLIRKRGMNPETVLDLLEDAGYSRWQAVDCTLLSREDLAKLGFNARFVALPSMPRQI